VHLNKRLIIGILFLLIVAGSFGSAGSLISYALSPAQPGSTSSVILEVRKNAGPGELAQLLSSKGIITSPSLFVWLGRLTRQWRRVKVGEYKLSPALNPVQVFGVITSGISVSHPLVVREGENIYEIANELSRYALITTEKFLELCQSAGFIKTLGFPDPAPETLEGYLFPDTYFINRTTTAEELVRKMVKRFFAVWGQKEEIRAAELRMSRQQIVTLASIIEKETGAPSERPLISSVFHNRLSKRMRLQSDPTTIYGIWERYQGNLRKSDLTANTPYNTYTIPGLPKGPISNPGKASLQAALFPVQSEYLFFVSHNDGTHEFTKTFAEHGKAVKTFQLDRKAREGKSWRDLKKSSNSSN